SVGTGFGAPKAKNAFVFESPLLPLPDCGVRTLTRASLGVATKLAGIVAVKVMPSTKVVASFLPFHWIAEAATKNPPCPLPVTVRRKSPFPAATPVGEMLLICGPVLYWIELL